MCSLLLTCVHGAIICMPIRDLDANDNGIMMEYHEGGGPHGQLGLWLC
eukprot:CAMPEP_0172320940 /NCGR_PEP_ID=MMETSP1058-20130122/41850_1 /TAXON_ID=83371 /ORGANISM="Detonula confervacea, Strain CCMP 353" /LENGTH=47 /DNA_ID= /DNA_START= /DNA_END= /DNA_ORIENTATION=